MLVIVTGAASLHGMEPQREKLSPITWSQTYYRISELLTEASGNEGNSFSPLVRYIFLLQLKASRIDLAKLPLTIEQNCESPETLVQLIQMLIKSCGYSLARELFKQFFPHERSICNIKNKNTKTDKHGETALHNAADGGSTAVVKFLLDIAGDNAWTLLIMKNIGGYNGYGGGKTALHYAVLKGHLEVVKLLLNAAGNKLYLLLEAKDYFGETALHKAVGDYNNIEVVKFLLDAAGDKVQDYIAMRGGYGDVSAFHLAGPEIEEVIKPYLDTQCCLVFYPDCVLF